MTRDELRHEEGRWEAMNPVEATPLPRPTINPSTNPRNRCRQLLTVQEEGFVGFETRSRAPIPEWSTIALIYVEAFDAQEAQYIANDWAYNRQRPVRVIRGEATGYTKENEKRIVARGDYCRQNGLRGYPRKAGA